MKKIGQSTRIKIALIILPIILFIFLAIFIQAGYSMGVEDKIYVETVEHMSPVITKILKIVTNIGGPIVIIIACFALLIIKKTRILIGIPVSLSVAVTEILNLILKNIFARERPNILRLVNETSYSFPSGHSMVNAAIYTMLALLAIRYIKNKGLKILSVLVCTVMPLLIGFSRIYLGVHFAGDVIGGLLMGFAISLIVYLLLKRDNDKISDK